MGKICKPKDSGKEGKIRENRAINGRVDRYIFATVKRLWYGVFSYGVFFFYLKRRFFAVFKKCI